MCQLKNTSTCSVIHQASVTMTGSWTIEKTRSFNRSIYFTLQYGKRFNANDKRDTHSAMSVNKNGLLFPLMELHVSQSYQIHCWWRYNDNDNEFLTIGIPIFYAFWLNTGLGKLKKEIPALTLRARFHTRVKTFPEHHPSNVEVWANNIVYLDSRQLIIFRRRSSKVKVMRTWNIYIYFLRSITIKVSNLTSKYINSVTFKVLLIVHRLSKSLE